MTAIRAETKFPEKATAEMAASDAESDSLAIHSLHCSLSFIQQKTIKKKKVSTSTLLHHYLSYTDSSRKEARIRNAS